MGETIHSLHKTTLIPGGSELLVYTTLSGTVGIMVLFTSREVFYAEGVLWSVCYYLFQDIDFFQHLEMHMHSELQSLVGRDHLSFRSYYLPIKVRLKSHVVIISCCYVCYFRV